ncbi:DUF4384 domain-containing protein [Piscinibacterium candidicorallinum]|uniref:DUF4384 domain-containing protein n=1 Tax=Piscinibacterium candidicorallinum TaxID=1793872 RepID=A0ABV7H6K9_9BURK
MRRFVFVLGSTLALLTGCANLDARRDLPLLSSVPTENRPVVRPVRSVSSFSESLVCMDRMFRDARVPPTLIASKQIPDASGKVPVAAKEMIVTALSQLSRTSGAFRYVDYEIDLVKQDTVQNLTTLLLNNNQIQLQRPALYVSGAISFFDQSVASRSGEVGTSASRLETGYSRNRSASLVGLELHLGEFRSRTLIPGIDSANEVVIGTGNEGLDVAGRIGRYGVQFNVGRDYAQGTGAAVRTLVELGLIEVLGKWARVPYWQCLSLDQAHPEFQRQMRDWFDEQKPEESLALVQRALVAEGYLQPPVATGMSPVLKTALARFQVDRGITPSGDMNFETWERALRNYVSFDDKGLLVRVGWGRPGLGQTDMAKPANAEAPALPELPGQPSGVDGKPVEPAVTTAAAPLTRQVDVRIENVLRGTSQFEVGEQVFLSATLSHAGFLYCFLQDATGTVVRVLPNNQHRSVMVPARQAVRMPDWMSPNPGFIIEPSDPGAEAFVCLASDVELTPKLPEPLRVAPFTPIQGIQTPDQLVTLFKQAGEVAVGTVSWRVVPRTSVQVKR